MTDLDAIRDEVLRRADIAAHAERAGFRCHPAGGLAHPCQAAGKRGLCDAGLNYGRTHHP